MTKILTRLRMRAHGAFRIGLFFLPISKIEARSISERGGHLRQPLENAEIQAHIANFEFRTYTFLRVHQTCYMIMYPWKFWQRVIFNLRTTHIQYIPRRRAIRSPKILTHNIKMLDYFSEKFAFLRLFMHWNSKNQWYLRKALIKIDNLPASSF